MPDPTINESIAAGLAYCEAQGVDVPAELYVRAWRVGAIKAEGDLAAVTARYRTAIDAALSSYFEGGSVTGPRNAFKRATVEAFGSAFDLGWIAGGGTPPPTGDALAWFNARLEQEFGFINGLFTQAKQLREDEEFEPAPWTQERADAYTRTLAAIYNAGHMWALKGKLLTWHLGNTEKHCPTCASLNGQRHRASWYLGRNYIPRQPGASMKCGGYFCDCRLTDDRGMEVTI